MKQLTDKEQIEIIRLAKERYARLLEPNFSADSLLECHDNIAITNHIESVQILQSNITNPTFSIAIPTYKRLETLRRALDSAFNQDIDEKYEILVVENVDDFASKTPAQEMIESRYGGGINYYKNRENLGLFGNWNRCLTLGKGKWICLLHSDDEISPHYLSEMKNIVSTHTNATIISTLETNTKSGDIYIGILGTIIRKIERMRTIDNCHFQDNLKCMQPNAILHNRQKTLALGGYNALEYPIADNFFYTRAYNKGEIVILNKILQTRHNEISEYYNPATLLGYCFFVRFYLQCYTPKAYAKIIAYHHMQHYQRLLAPYPLLQRYAMQLATHFGIRKPSMIAQKSINLYNFLKKLSRGIIKSLK